MRRRWFALSPRLAGLGLVILLVSSAAQAGITKTERKDPALVPPAADGRLPLLVETHNRALIAARVEALGGRVTYVFENLDALAVLLPPHQVDALLKSEGVNNVVRQRLVHLLLCLALADLAAGQPGGRVSATATVEAPYCFPNGCYVAEVEVDPETGTVAVASLVALDDMGRVINPMIVHGQVHGGLAQGIGQALLEEARYDSESGQLLTGSLMFLAAVFASGYAMAYFVRRQWQ